MAWYSDQDVADAVRWVAREVAVNETGLTTYGEMLRGIGLPTTKGSGQIAIFMGKIYRLQGDVPFDSAVVGQRSQKPGRGYYDIRVRDGLLEPSRVGDEAVWRANLREVWRHVGRRGA